MNIQNRNWVKIFTSLGWAWEIMVQDRFIPNIIHMEKLCHQRRKIISVAQYVCKTIHKGPGNGWLPSDIRKSWHQKFWNKLEGLQEFTTWSEVTSAEWLIQEAGYIPFAQRRCTKIPSWNQDVSTNGPTWWLTWVLIKLCIMIRRLAMPGYSMPGSSIKRLTSWERDIRRMSNIFCRNTII